MRRLNSDLSDKSEDWKTPYLDILAVGIIQFLLSLLILSYGVFLMQFILKDSFNLKTSLWTAVAHVAISKITNPWVRSYCKHLENIKHRVHKRNIIIIVLLLFGDLLFLSFNTTQTLVIICYGIFGGLFSSFIYVHIQFATADVFRHHPQLFKVLDQIVKSSCLLLTPHLILFLTNFYGPAQVFLILAALILNIIPFSLLIKTQNPKKVRLCKFETIDKLSIEMTELNSKPIIREPSTSSSSEDEEEEEELEDEEEHKEEEDRNERPGPAPVSSVNVQRYYQNVGVKILPNIPEESDYEEDDDINEISSKRLSRISAILQEINDNAHRDVNTSVNNLYQPDEMIESVEDEDIPDMDDRKSKKCRCFSISSNLIYDLKSRRRKTRSFFNKQVRTVGSMVKTPEYYPALVSSCITTTFSSIVFTTAPYLMFFKNEDRHIRYPNTPEESTFLLTIIGFTWLFFLAGYPVFNKLSSLKTRILFLVGLSILGLSLFIVHKFSYDNFVLFSLTFGIGHGIVSHCENIANEDFFGEAKWRMIQGALEISTGLIVILTYFIIYSSSLDVYFLISNGYWFYFFDVILWSVAYLTKKLIHHCKNRRTYNVQKNSDFKF